jgi:hypothetical protein
MKEGGPDFSKYAENCGALGNFEILSRLWRESIFVICFSIATV